jgi:hypothetical protein
MCCMGYAVLIYDQPWRFTAPWDICKSIIMLARYSVEKSPFQAYQPDVWLYGIHIFLSISESSMP